VIACPNCRNATASRTLPAIAPARPVVVEICAACNLLWFDNAGSIRLAPQAVIELFKAIGETAGAARTPLASTFRCPQCSRPLLFTHDLQRTTRFTYWRCPRDNGQLISFHQFLREKNFIRTPSPSELAKLRATVGALACSQCGAPVNLATDSACPHCGTPIALVDPDGVAKALAELASSSAQGAPADPRAMRAILAEAEANALMERERSRDDETTAGHDLVAIGIAAIGAWLVGR
jgi:hypothetical protein